MAKILQLPQYGVKSGLEMPTHVVMLSAFSSIFALLCEHLKNSYLCMDCVTQSLGDAK